MKRYRILLLILLGALLLRGGIAMAAKKSFSMDPDSYSYETIAHTILQNGTLTPSANRTPGFPAFIAMIYAVLGSDFKNIVLVQALIATLTIVLVYMIGRKVIGERAGLMAAALVAVDPFQVYFSAKVLTETLFTFMLCLIVYAILFLQEDQTHGGRTSFILGLLLGLTALLRPEVVGLAVVLAAGYGISVLLKRRNFRGMVNMGIMLLTMAAILLPWGLRNQRLLGRFVVTSTNGGWTMYEGLATDYSVDGWDKYRREKMYPDLTAYGLDNELKVNDHFAAKSRIYIREHPGDFILLSVRKLFKLYRVIPYEVFSMKARIASVLYFLPLLLLFIAGMVLTRSQVIRLMPIYLVLAYVSGIHMLFTSQIRYRVPLQPLMAVVAAAAIVMAIDRLPGRRGLS